MEILRVLLSCTAFGKRRDYKLNLGYQVTELWEAARTNILQRSPVKESFCATVRCKAFRDGNGRAARLIEKWFVAEKLGHDFWKIPSEEYYKNNQARNYETINLGVNFYELNYDKCNRFLEMLPNCLK